MVPHVAVRASVLAPMSRKALDEALIDVLTLTKPSMKRGC